MRISSLVATLPLLAQVACAGSRYAVSDETAAARHDRRWHVRREPPEEPVPAPVATPETTAAEPVAAEGAAPSDGVAPSQAAFPEPEAALAPEEPSQPGSGTDETVPRESTTTDAALEPESPAQPSPVVHERIDLSQENESASSEPGRPKLRRMVWGLSMRFGGTFGSEDLLVVSYTDGSTEALTTGGGVNFFLGTTVIPLELGNHSLGFGVEGGWKFSSIGQGSDTEVSFSRKAFMPRVQYGYELAPAIHWILSAGAQYETDITFKARGGFVGSAKFDNALGYFGETGVWFDIGLFGLDLTLRHTRIDYALPDGPSISGNSFGIFCALQIGIIKAENPITSTASTN